MPREPDVPTQPYQPDYYARTLDELRRVLFSMPETVTLTRDDLMTILLMSEDEVAVVWWLINRCASDD